jgi:hypothetical protein
MPYYYYWDPVQCVTRPITSCAVMGGLFTALDAAQTGAPPRLRTFGLYAGGLYLYNIVQCPLEAMNGGRPSAWHNILAGGTLGYMGVRHRLLGIPLVDQYFFLRNPQLAPELVGAAVYAAMAGGFAVLGGKPF